MLNSRKFPALNADQSTWKLLGLKRQQIERMNELRGLYPAVVDGQWIGSDDEEETVPAASEPTGVSSTVSSSISGPDAGSVTMDRVNEAHSPATTTAKTGLQHDIRSALTPMQLKRWAKHCE